MSETAEKVIEAYSYLSVEEKVKFDKRYKVLLKLRKTLAKAAKEMEKK